PVDEHTKAALYSFAFNVGTGAFAKSTMLKKLNAGDQYGACEELKRWVYAGGKVWRGLVNRREAEAAICHGNL
ncbi:glycoside hydrolase family protein, partial [Providencia sp. NPDC089923]